MQKRALLLLLQFILMLNCIGQISFTCPLNAQQSIQTGGATVTATTLDIGTVSNIFDGNDLSLARSANINPLVITISFSNTVNLTSVRVIQSYGEGWFTLEAANSLADLNGQNGSYQLLASQVPTINGVPIGGAISMAITTSKKIFRLTVRKTVGDNFVHLNEWGLNGTIENIIDAVNFSPSQIKMYPGWKIYLNQPGWHQVPKLTGVVGSVSSGINNSCILWSVANTSIAEIAEGVLIAKSAGNTFLIGSIGNGSVQIPVSVQSSILPEEKNTSIDNFLITPADCYSLEVPVLILVYLPTKDGIYFDSDEIPGYNNQLLTNVKEHAKRIFIHTKFSLEEGSKYRGYSNPSAKPYLGYKVVDYIYIYEPLPLSIQDNPANGNFWVDYYQVVEKHKGKQYVENLGVKEIWVMGYHTDKVSPLESNMASKTTGNISNSYRRENDLPKYDKTYVVYNYNITRGGNEATHNHGHQIEAMCDYVAIKQDGNSSLFWQKFVGRQGNNPPVGRNGDTHHPPNTQSDYDYNNNTLIASDIKDWKPAGGTTTQVNNNTWGSINYAWPSLLSPLLTPNVESNWYIFWMQSIPGAGNQIPNGSKWMSNWWEFLSNWDSNTVKIGLYQSAQASTSNGCTTTGLFERSITNQLKLFPNPVKEKIFFSEKEIECSYSVFNQSGQKLLYGKGRIKNIDISKLPPGVYFLRIEEKEKYSGGRFYKS